MTQVCDYRDGFCLTCGRRGNTVRRCVSSSVNDHKPLHGHAGHAAKPGATLSWIFAVLGIHGDYSCSCKSVARMMDVNGPRWCIANCWELAEIVKANAKRRGKSCPLVAAWLIVMLAVIISARKNVWGYLTLHPNPTPVHYSAWQPNSPMRPSLPQRRRSLGGGGTA